MDLPVLYSFCSRAFLWRFAADQKRAGKNGDADEVKTENRKIKQLGADRVKHHTADQVSQDPGCGLHRHKKRLGAGLQVVRGQIIDVVESRA